MNIQINYNISYLKCLIGNDFTNIVSKNKECNYVCKYTNQELHFRNLSEFSNQFFSLKYHIRQMENELNANSNAI